MANNYTQITAITQDVIIPKLEDQIFLASPLFKYLMNKVKVQVGGTQLQQPVIKSKDSQGGSYGRGDTFDAAASNTRDKFIFDWKSVEQPIVVFGIDMAMSAGVSKVIDHVKGKVEEAMMNMSDKLADMFFGDGTGNSSKDLTGLAAIVDDGTNVATYGGITRATDVWAKAGYVNSVGNIQLSDLKTGIRTADTGDISPDLIVTTKNTRDDIEDLMTPTTQNTIAMVAGSKDSMKADQGLKLSYGATQLSYKGLPIVGDRHCTSDKAFILNTARLFLTILKQGDPDMKETAKMGISMTPMQRPSNQDGIVSHLLMYGEFTTSEPRAHYQLDGITNP